MLIKNVDATDLIELIFWSLAGVSFLWAKTEQGKIFRFFNVHI